MYMLLMVLDDSARLKEVLEAWAGAGIDGITILESTGMNRLLLRTQAHAMMAGFSQLLAPHPVGHNTIFAVVDNQEVALAAVAATEGILGSLDGPDTGLVVLLPLVRAWGLPKEAPAPGHSQPPGEPKAG